MPLLIMRGSTAAQTAGLLSMNTTGDTSQGATGEDGQKRIPWQLQRLHSHVLESMTAEQKGAVIEAVDASWSRHPVDIRFSVPWVGSNYFVTIISGKERRDRERRSKEVSEHPLVTFGNILFSLVFALIFFVGLTTLGFIFLFAVGRITW